MLNKLHSHRALVTTETALDMPPIVSTLVNRNAIFFLDIRFDENIELTEGRLAET